MGLCVNDTCECVYMQGQNAIRSKVLEAPCYGHVLCAYHLCWDLLLAQPYKVETMDPFYR